MKIFIMHIGSKGSIDIDYTITRQREITEILDKLPENAPEASFFQSDNLKKAFPNGKFNCWDIPSNAEPRFIETQIGDLVLFIPHIGENKGGIYQLGVIKAKCPVRSYDASKILWPSTPEDKLYPFIFFFDTEIGYKDWEGFLLDIDIKPNWNPNGYYRKIMSKRFEKFLNEEGYLKYLRNNFNFKKLNIEYPTPEEAIDNSLEEDYILYYSDDRENIIRNIKLRRGQQSFRNGLRERYGNNCMVTGCQIIDIIEAAHIKPYRNTEDNSLQNGLLLRADIHTLFDLDLISIHPENLTVEISPSLKGSEYEILNNKKILLNFEKKPSSQALKYRYEIFCRKNDSNK